MDVSAMKFVLKTIHHWYCMKLIPKNGLRPIAMFVFNGTAMPEVCLYHIFWSRNYGMFFVKQKSEPRILRALGCFFRGVPFWNQKINICLIPRTLVSYSCCILSRLLVLFHMWASYSNITADWPKTRWMMACEGSYKIGFCDYAGVRSELRSYGLPYSFSIWEPRSC